MIDVILYVKDNDGDDEGRKTKMPALPRVGDYIYCFELFEDVWIDGFNEDTHYVVIAVDWAFSGEKWKIDIHLEQASDE